MKLLIVDDLEMIRDLIKSRVAKLPFITEIQEAATVTRAILAVVDLQPDVMTLDMEMPGGSGLDVLRAVKHMTHSPTVIVMTNQTDPQIRQACLAAGASYFLDKSHDIDKLPAILTTLAGNTQES